MIGNKIKGIHPYAYRSGEEAVIKAVFMREPEGLKPRLCYEVEYKDGVIDYVPVCDGSNYDIEVVK